MSRTVNGARIFRDGDKEVFRKQLRAVADYCGVQVVTWTIMNNHFHVLTRVPQAVPVSDEELLRRYDVLYPQPTKYQTMRLEVIKKYLADNAPEGEKWRRQQLAQMGELSAFMKLLKQRFSVYFNKRHNRFGPLWAERFTSVLVETGNFVARAMSAYIDLNCVRAGICADPKDYRFCGYAEAVKGLKIAQEGLMSVLGGTDWNTVQAAYRQILFTTGAEARENAGRISQEAMQAVLVAGGKLTLPTVLRSKLNYFTGSAVLGGQAFVEDQLIKYRKLTGRRKQIDPCPVPKSFDWGGLFTLRRC